MYPAFCILKLRSTSSPYIKNLSSKLPISSKTFLGIIIKAPANTSTSWFSFSDKCPRWYLANLFDRGNNMVRPASLYNDVSGEGKALLLSFKNFPVPSIIRMPTAPAVLFFFKNCMQFSILSSGNMVSGFKKSIKSPFALARAWLLALAKPALLLFHKNLTPANAGSSKALLPSVELLSATITSASIFKQAFCTENRHCSKKCFTL